MKIVFINPPICNFTGECNSHTPPLGLMYLASVLENGGYKDIKIIDAEVLSLSWGELETKIKQQSPDIVGITATSISLPAFFETAKIAKKIVPEALILGGGPGPTFEPERVLRDLDVLDVVAIDEAENTIIDLVKYWQGDKKIEDIKGVAFREGGKVRINEPQILVEDLDSIGLPTYHFLEPSTLSYYSGVHKYSGLKLPHVAVMGSRGCPHRCIFCSNNKIKTRLRDPQKIVDEIEFCHKQLGANTIQLYDNEFIGMSRMQNKWIRDICEEIIHRKLDKLNYLAQGRCSQFVDLETLNMMKKAGFKWIWWGVESGSQKVLDLMKKDTSVENIKKSFHLAREAGIKSMAFIIVGIPGETEEDVKLTSRLIGEIKPDKTSVHVINPLPGSELWKTLENKGQIDDYNFLNYNTRGTVVHHTEELSSEKIKELFNFLIWNHESNKQNFVKLFLKSFFSLKEFKKLPVRFKKFAKFAMRKIRFLIGK